MFNPAGIFFRHFRVNSCGDKLLSKKAVLFINLFSNLSANIGQMEKMIFVHCEKAAIFQSIDCHAYTWL